MRHDTTTDATTREECTGRLHSKEERKKYAVNLMAVE